MPREKKGKKEKKSKKKGKKSKHTFSRWLTKQGLADSTARKYVAVMKRWQKSDLSLSAFLEHEWEKSQGGSGFLPVQAAVRRYASWSGKRVKYKAKRLQASTYKGVVLTKAQALALLSDCPDTLGRRLMEVVIECGLRGGELVQVDYEEVLRTGTFRAIGKRNHPVATPATQRALDLARSILDDFSRKPCTDAAALRALWRSTRSQYRGPLAQSLVDQVKVHTFRHVFSGSLRAKRVSRETIGTLLNHSSRASVDRYLHACDKQDAIRLLNVTGE